MTPSSSNDSTSPRVEPARAALIASGNTANLNTAPRDDAESLGDSVYVKLDSGMIRLSGNAFARENVIFLESAVYSALRRWAQTHGFETASRDEQVRSGNGIDRPLSVLP